MILLLLFFICCCYCSLFIFFFPNERKTNSGTSSDNQILGASPSVSVYMLPKKMSVLATPNAGKVQKSFSVIMYFQSLENTFSSQLTLVEYHFIEIFASSNWPAGNSPQASLKHIFFIYNGKEVCPIIVSDIKMYFSLTEL